MHVLATFPSDDEIHNLLIISKSRAELHIELTGMQTVKDLQGPNITSLSDAAAFNLDLSSHTNPWLTSHVFDDTSEAMKRAAAIFGQRHGLDCEIDDLDFTNEVVYCSYLLASKNSINTLKTKPTSDPSQEISVDLESRLLSRWSLRCES